MILTADEEMPDCGRCCHIADYSCDYCCDFCGPEHGWAEYAHIIDETQDKEDARSDIWN